MNLPILAPIYKWAIAGLSAIILALGVALYFTSESLDKYRTQAIAAGSVLTIQNEAVKNLQRQRNEDVKRYQDGLKDARKSADRTLESAADILAARPGSADLCAEASSLIDRQIAKERP